MAATIYDVAKMSGLSLGTVSKYINGKPVKEKNKEKIEKAIQVLNYRPNNIAKGLRQARTYTIAVLVPKLSSSFSTTIITAIEQFLLPYGYCVIVCECHDDDEMEIKKTEFLLSRLIDGIILLPYSPNGKQLELIKQNHVPVVVIDQMIINHEADYIILDNEPAIFEPTEKLIHFGHRDIALLTGSSSLYTSKVRTAGYRKAMEKYALPVHDYFILNGNYTMAGACQALTQLYQAKEHIPTAIICSNYEMTLGALLALNNLNLKIPDDISVIGFDNLPLTKVVSPPLFTIAQPMEEMGISAAKLLYKRINGDYSDFPQTISHKATFVSITESIREISVH